MDAALAELADAYGVATSYWDWQGRFVEVDPDVVVAILGVLDVDATGEAPAVNQIPWSPFGYDAGLVAAHRERGVVVEGYSPFKGSDLRHPVLSSIAAAHRVTPAQVVLRWHIQHEIVVIPKSVTPERIAENFDVLGFELTDEEMAAIDGLGRRR